MAAGPAVVLPLSSSFNQRVGYKPEMGVDCEWMPFFRPYCIALLLIAGFSCKHEARITPNVVPTASISFTAPAPGTVFRAGDRILIQAVALSTAPIHGFDLSIHRASDKTVYYFNHIHDHNDTLRISEAWTNILNSPTELEAVITLYLDHEGNLYQSGTSFKTE